MTYCGILCLMTYLLRLTWIYRWIYRVWWRSIQQKASEMDRWKVGVSTGSTKTKWDLSTRHGMTLEGGYFVWLVVWLPWILFSQKYWECHHPNWLSYFSERFKPPTSLCFLFVVFFFVELCFPASWQKSAFLLFPASLPRFSASPLLCFLLLCFSAFLRLCFSLLCFFSHQNKP